MEKVRSSLVRFSRVSAARQLRDGVALAYRRVSHTLTIIGAVLKLLLISILLATFLLPAVAASGKKPLPSLRALLTSILLAELAYAFFLRFIYGRLL
jgi:hypothetical protein